jgi:hypothetical protein
VGYELARALLLAEIVTPQTLERALFASLQQGTTLPRALLDTGALDVATLEDMLGRADAPSVRTVMPLVDLMVRLPPGLCARLLAVPIRRDPTTGTIDVAVADVREPHVRDELEFHLGSAVRLVRAPVSAIEEGLHRKSRTMPPAASIRGSAMPPPGLTAAALRNSRPPMAGMPYASSPNSPMPRADYADGSAPSDRFAPPSRPPASRYPGMGVIAAVVPERRQIPAAAPTSPSIPSGLSGAPYGQEPPRAGSMTPPWGTAVPSVRPTSMLSHHSMPQSKAQLFGQSGEPGTNSYGTVPEPDETRPGPVVPPHLGGSLAPHTERTPAVERPIPLTRMSVNAPRERAATLYYERHPTQLPHTPYGESEPLPSFIPGPPPRTARGPYNAQSGFPFADGSSVVAALRNADDRDHVLDLLLMGARAVARKVAVFVVKRGGLVGWTCTPEFGERVQLQALMMSLTTPSIFTTAMNEGLYLGAIRHDDVHAPLLRVMGGASRDVAVAPVRVLGKAAVVLVADDLGDTMIATRRLEELARAAGEAFARIMKAKAK